MKSEIEWAGQRGFGAATLLPDKAIYSLNHGLREFSKEVSKKCCSKRCETAGYLERSCGEASPMTCFEYVPRSRYGCASYKHDDFNEGCDCMIASLDAAIEGDWNKALSLKSKADKLLGDEDGR